MSERKVSTDGDLNVFISDRHMSLNEAILQGDCQSIITLLSIKI